MVDARKMIVEMTDRLIHERDEALDRIRELEAQLREANATIERLNTALEFAAKDCLNSEGTYGEALKRIKLVEEWKALAEKEIASRLKEGK